MSEIKIVTKKMGISFWVKLSSFATLLIVIDKRITIWRRNSFLGNGNTLCKTNTVYATDFKHSENSIPNARLRFQIDFLMRIISTYACKCSHGCRNMFIKPRSKKLNRIQPHLLVPLRHASVPLRHRYG